jgi:Flp pilus assembly pilin Flp
VGDVPGDVCVYELGHQFFNDENAATSIVYGLIAAGIALAVITVVNRLGTALLLHTLCAVELGRRSSIGLFARFRFA